MKPEEKDEKAVDKMDTIEDKKDEKAEDRMDAIEDKKDEKAEDKMDAIEDIKEEEMESADPLDHEWGEWDPPADQNQEKQDKDDDHEHDTVENWIQSFQLMKKIFFNYRELSEEMSEMCEEAILKFKLLKRKREEKEREEEKRRKLDEEWANL